MPSRQPVLATSSHCQPSAPHAAEPYLYHAHPLPSRRRPPAADGARASTSWRRRSRRSRAARRCCRCARSFSFRKTTDAFAVMPAIHRHRRRRCRREDHHRVSRAITAPQFDSHQGAVLLFDREQRQPRRGARRDRRSRRFARPPSRRSRRGCSRAKTRRRSRSSAPACRRTRTSRRCAPCGRSRRCASGAATPSNARTPRRRRRATEFELDASCRRRAAPTPCATPTSSARRRRRASRCCSASGSRRARTSTPSARRRRARASSTPQRSSARDSTSTGASRRSRSRATFSFRCTTATSAPSTSSAEIGELLIGRGEGRRDEQRDHALQVARPGDRRSRGVGVRLRRGAARRRRRATSSSAGRGLRRIEPLDDRRRPRRARAHRVDRRRERRSIRLNVDAPAEIYLKLEIAAADRLVQAARRDERDPYRCRRKRSSDGVYTASAGNMAQGVAWGARELGVPCTVVMPDNAPRTKVDAVERLGATIVPVPYDEWWQTLARPRARGHGRHVHPPGRRPRRDGRQRHDRARDRRGSAGRRRRAGAVRRRRTRLRHRDGGARARAQRA